MYTLVLQNCGDERDEQGKYFDRVVKRSGTKIVQSSIYSPSVKSRRLLKKLLTPKKFTSVLKLNTATMKKLLAIKKSKRASNVTTESVLETYASRPTIAWNLLESSQVVRTLKPIDAANPKPPGHTRFVCISDTHNRTDKLEHVIPDGDILIHAGDFTNFGSRDQVIHFDNFLSTLNHPHKVVIAGNHDISFDLKNYDSLWSYFSRTREDPVEIRQKLTNCIYLEDEEVTLLGFRIFGSPWTPEFCEWGFMKARGEPIQEVWNKIPDGTDILITHGPPLGHGDRTISNVRAGCLNLLHTVQSRVKPKYHVFGHIHEGYGVTTDEVTTFVNASSVTIQYKPSHPPIVFDLPNKETCEQTTT